MAKDVLHGGGRADDERRWGESNGPDAERSGGHGGAEGGGRQPRMPDWRRLLAAARARLPRRLRGSRAAAAGLVVVVILGAVWFLRSGASRLEVPERAPGGSGAPSEPPVLTSDTPFALLVQGGVQRVVRIDRRQDRDIVRELPESPGGVRPDLAAGAWLTADVTVLLGPAAGGKVAVILDRANGEPRRIGPGVDILPGPHGWTAWLVRAAGAGRLTAQEFGSDDAKALGPAFAVPAGTRPVAVVRESLVLSRDGGVLSVWRPGRPPEPLGAAGHVVGAAGDLVVVAQDCPRSAECPHSVINTATGDVSRLGVAERMRPLGPPVISQDGLWIAQLVEPDTTDSKREAALAYGSMVGKGDDLAEVPGTRHPLPPGSAPNLVQPTWSLQGRIFGYLPDDKYLYAYQPGDTIARRLAVPAPKPVSRIVAG